MQKGGLEYNKNMKDNIYKVLFYISLPLIGTFFSLYINTRNSADVKAIQVLETKITNAEEKINSFNELQNKVSDMNVKIEGMSTNIEWIKKQIETRKAGLIDSLLAVPTKVIE